MSDTSPRKTAKPSSRTRKPPEVSPAPARQSRAGRPRVRHDALTDAPALVPDGEVGEDIIARIYQTVFDSVMSQRLTPGTKLPEAALCELFGVGRTVVQKALQKLAHEHIVELRPNRGAVVAMPTPEETREIFQARRALEGAIMRLAVQNATRADLAKLRRQLKEEHEVMHSYAQTHWARLASSFHMRVAELSRNATLQRYLSELVSRCSLIVALHEPAGYAACEHDEHTHIVDLIERGDAEGAVAAMEAHLLSLEEHIHLVSEKSGNSLARMLGME
ncbi:GntR family transcriptional regulator [Herbaspirillum sp. BH-1]|uniref:DNA-binding GntR family transcriptional regulator n=1 Tax=Herbaspirillum frisingense TaxID=92645 RepID=A0ABU1PB87_9BURK|nr:MULTISPECIES: GntR family transcriptional regulator [Herbaspirillum]MDR6583194.1 DNA-binding GntR family transcriptional regulator [Herbaspirillum frisingense]PLY60109.1 GntR family transcriptional regulator [Herbaspirillum sp. BH-1]